MEEGIPSPRLVLVDDHEALNAGLAILLERRGFRVSALAGSAAEGERAIAEQRPDIGIVSLTLSDEDGASMVRRLKAGGCTSRFVVYTGLTDPPSSPLASKAAPRVASPRRAGCRSWSSACTGSPAAKPSAIPPSSGSRTPTAPGNRAC